MELVLCGNDPLWNKSSVELILITTTVHNECAALNSRIGASLLHIITNIILIVLVLMMFMVG